MRATPGRSALLRAAMSALLMAGYAPGSDGMKEQLKRRGFTDSMLTGGWLPNTIGRRKPDDARLQAALDKRQRKAEKRLSDRLYRGRNKWERGLTSADRDERWPPRIAYTLTGRNFSGRQ